MVYFGRSTDYGDQQTIENDVLRSGDPGNGAGLIAVYVGTDIPALKPAWLPNVAQILAGLARTIFFNESAGKSIHSAFFQVGTLVFGDFN